MNEFSETGFNDVTVGAELFNQLQIGYIELADPRKVSMLQEISGFLNEHPDPLFLIGSISRSRGTQEPLEHFASYVQLSKQKQQAQEQVDKLNKELEYYG